MVALIAQVFMEEVPDQVAALDVAIAARDPETVRRIAHRLRGSALALGAGRMAQVCAAIEYASRDGAIDEAATESQILPREFEAVTQALRNEIH